MKRVTLLLALVLAPAACTPQPAVSVSPAQTPAPSVSPAALPVAAVPLWTYRYAPNSYFSGASLSDGIAITSGPSGLMAFDEKNGHVLWRSAHKQFIPYRDGARLYADGGGGTIAAISAATGSITWRSSGICPKLAYTVNPNVLYAADDGVYAACGDRLTRLRPRDGAQVASRAALPVYMYQTVRPAGQSALALGGYSDGAAMAFHEALVRRDTLQSIDGPRQDVTFLGMDHGQAILDDGCCFGRPDVYEPATIFHVSPDTGRASTPVDLRPDPQLFPADQRPIGQGAAAALIDGRLFLAIQPMLYDYGNPLILTQTPKRVLNTLMQVPVFMGGFVFAQVRQQNGSVQDEIIDLRGGGMLVRWKHREGAMAMPYYDPASPGVAAVTEFYRGWQYTMIVRLADGAQIDVGTCGRPFAADGARVLVHCMGPRPSTQESVRAYAFGNK